MLFKKFFILLVLFSFSLSAQHKYNTYTAHYSIEKAIKISSDIIEGRTEFFEKQAEEKPLMFQKTKVMIGELNRLSNNITKYIKNTQEEVNREQVLYDLLESNHYKNLIFKESGGLTIKGDSLRVKIDSLYIHSKRINVHRLSQLENFYEEHFKTNADFYHNEDKISYFDYLFYDKSNYGMMMAMNYLLLDVKTFQLLYYGTVMNY